MTTTVAGVSNQYPSTEPTGDAEPATGEAACGMRSNLSIVALLVLVGWVGGFPLQADGQTTGAWFVDRAAAEGIDFTPRYGSIDRRFITDAGGSGAAWLDYDVDGVLDLFLPDALETLGGSTGNNGATGRGGHRLFRRDRVRFREVAESAGVADSVWANGAAVGDYDSDGWPDLMVTAIGPDRLYRNNGDGTFAAVSVGVEHSGWSTTAVFLDWDGDGHLDLYVTRYVDFDLDQAAAAACHFHLRGVEVFCGPHGLAGARDSLYRNRGDGTFEVWPGAAVDTEATYGLAALALDCDGDARPELYVATDSTINLLYRRDLEGLPEDWSFLSGAGLSAAGIAQAGMGVSAGDFDGDGHFDLVVTNFQHDRNNLYRGLGDCTFEDVAEIAGLGESSIPYMGWGVLFLDVDGDADLDIFVANGHIYPQVDGTAADPGARGDLFDERRDPQAMETYAQRNLLFANRLRESGEPVTEEVGASSGPGLARLAVSRGASWADYDNDGDVDILVTSLDSAPSLLVNQAAMALPALRLTLVGRTSNRSAYGARVRVSSGGISQVVEIRHSDGYLGSNDTRALIFLPAGHADSIQITWPSGATTVLTDIEPGHILVDEIRGLIAVLSIEDRIARQLTRTQSLG